MSTTTTRPVMDELLRPLSQKLTPEFARTLVGLRADAAVQKRVAALAAKANEGSLSGEDKEEYHTYVIAGSMIAYLQAEARLLLARHES